MQLAWAADRRALVAACLPQLAQAAFAAFGLLAVNQVLIGLFSLAPTADRIRAAVPALALIALFAGAGSLAKAMSTSATGRLTPKVQRLAEERLLARVTRVELKVLEDSGFQRSLAGAHLGVQAIEQLVSTVLAAGSALISVVAALGVLGVLHPLLVPLLLLAVVPAAWKAVTVAQWEHLSAMKWLNQTRQKDVLANLLTDDGAPAEEIRVHGIGDYLLGHYRRLARALEAESARLSLAQARIGLLADAAGGVARVIAYVALGGLLMSGVVVLAAAGTAVVAMMRITSQLSALLLQIISLYRHGLFAADYSKTLQATEAAAIPTDGREVLAGPAVIEARGVRFSYPGSASAVLKGVDLDLRRGEVVALVGANGSGKTTLARLIAGLYMADAGSIRWDSIDIEELDRLAMFRQVAWIGQDFQRWPFTARMNATLGRPEAGHDEDRLAAAAEFADASQLISELPESWDTLLAKEFQGGVNLSGGQWQRLALARAHFRDAAILICDEPTAALDPMTEVESFERLMALAGNDRTVVLITHRLGSVKYADRIYVLDDGRVAESGTHAELMDFNGIFARMYRTQRGQYERTDLLDPPGIAS